MRMKEYDAYKKREAKVIYEINEYKANEKISEFFDKLTLDSNTTHAMHMTKEISNSDVRDQLLVKLSLHLAGINEDKICKQTIEICTNSQNESSNQAD